MSLPPSSPQPLTSLDILGIGLSIEMFSQSLAWDEMQLYETGSIFQTELTKFGERSGADGSVFKERAANALAACIQDFVHDWSIPTVCILPQQPEPKSPLGGVGANGQNAIESWIDGLRVASELSSHRLGYMGCYFDKEPEHIIERVFQFLDAHQDVPALLICATDGDIVRKLLGDANHRPGTVSGNHRFDSLVESAAFLLVGRKERSRMLRYFAGTPATHIYAPGPPRPGFKPSKFVPSPWTHEQLDQFDSTQVVARISRPARVSYLKQTVGESGEDAIGLMPDRERFETFEATFKDFVASLGQNKTSRIFFDNGGPQTGRHVVPLTLAIGVALPDFDLFDRERGFDIYQRIGNLGTTSPFVQWALAAYASRENGDASLIVSLRKKTEATLISTYPAAIAAAKSSLSDEVGRQQLAAPVATVAVAESPVSSPKKAQSPSVPLGTASLSGEECPQSGMWKCEPPDAEYGAIHFIPIGRSFPAVTIARELTTMQKLRREATKEKVKASWQLVSYEMRGQ